MGWNIALAPLFPWALIAVAAVMGVLLLALSAYARARGVWLRALAFALLLLALANPSVRNKRSNWSRPCST